MNIPARGPWGVSAHAGACLTAHLSLKAAAQGSARERELPPATARAHTGTSLLEINTVTSWKAVSSVWTNLFLRFPHICKFVTEVFLIRYKTGLGVECSEQFNSGKHTNATEEQCPRASKSIVSTNQIRKLFPKTKYQADKFWQSRILEERHFQIASKTSRTNEMAKMR